MKMNKLIYFVSVLFALAVVSCDDYLDAPAKSSLEESVIFSTYDLAKGAVDGIKVSFGETNSYRGRFIPWYGMNTDCEWYNSSEDVGDGKADLAVYKALPNNGQMNALNNAWAKMYEGIERANVCIEGLRAYGDIENNAELAYLLGESLTLRAIYYSDLLKAWGDIPARFEPITSETMYAPKSDRDVIYKQLLADLEEAAKYVPWPGEDLTSTTENINKAFVKGFRARLALNAGGYSQRPDGDYLSKSTDPDLATDKMMALAKQECLDIIASGSAQLEDFETVFRKMCEDKISTGGESLWEIPFADGRGRVLFTFAVRHNSVDQHTSQARGGQAGPVPNLWYDYDAKDLRRDVSVVPYEWDKADAEGWAKQKMMSLKKWAFGKYRYEWMTRTVTSTNDDGVNKIYMRYAEVVLMAAEAVNYIDGPEAAKPYLQMIRERSFAQADWSAKVTDYLNSITTKEQMLRAIQDEHKFEFVGEMIRKEALIRWGILGESLDETKARMYALRSRSTGSYDGVDFDYTEVPEKVYSWINADDNESIEYYGLERGEFDDMSGENIESTTWVAPDELEDIKIESIYAQDPDQWQFWPIWQVFLDASNGTLTNDYGY